MAMIDSKAAVPEPIAPGARRRVRDDVHQHEPFEPIAIIRIAVAALGAAAVWFRVYEPVAQVSVIGLLALAFSVWPVLREALANLLARRMTMELSMLIAIVAAAAIAEIFTALVVTLFVLVAEELEHLTIARGRRAIGDLVAFIPREARIRRGDDTVMVPVDTVALGDIVLVNPGEKIPVDGDVVAGHSSVDQSRITGESMPVDKTEGGAVYAGSINHMGALEIRVERVGRDTSYGQIIEAVEAAEHSRAPVQKLADRLAGYLVYVAAICAALTWLITRDMRDTISVIIVAGACGIAAGTPIAILGGIGRAARLGAIIKGGIHLETLGRVDTIVLDKTGTLTLGQPGVEQILPAPGVDPLELLRLTAAAEMRSEHPLARAVVEKARAQGLAVPEPSSAEFKVARGITAVVEGRTVLVGNRALLEEAGVAVPPRDHPVIGSDIVVATDGRFIGEIIVADALRPEAAAAMAALAAIGVRTLLFSGDSSVVAKSVAREIGIAEAVGDMLPQDKLVRVRALVKEGRVVGMVGDGVNDAPALTAASLGIAMGAGTDIAKDSADIILIGNDLLKLVDTLQIARRTRSVIWQNFAGTLIVDAIGIGLAATGFLSPVIAAFIHVGSELVFLGNSARMLPRGAEDEPAPLAVPPAMPLVAPATVENA